MDGRVGDAGPITPVDCLLPRLVCCLGRLGRLLTWPRLRLLIEGSEVGGGGCFNDHVEANPQGRCSRKASGDRVLDNCLDARSGCVSAPGALERQCLALFCTRFWTGQH